MCRLRWLCGGILMLLTLTVSAQDLRTQVEQTGDDWLIDILKDHPMDNARELIDDILREVATHVGDAEPSDDITLLCLKI